MRQSGGGRGPLGEAQHLKSSAIHKLPADYPSIGQSGHCSAMARDGSVAIDPERSSSPSRIRSNPPVIITRVPARGEQAIPGVLFDPDH